MRVTGWSGLTVIALGIGVLALVSGPAAGSSTGDMEAARAAWEEGDYVAALQEWIRVLEAPGADAHLREIALRTGELYAVREVAPDGRSIRISPSGQWAAFEVGGELETRTRVVPLGHEGSSLELPGTDFAFAPDGPRGIYRSLTVGDELRVARKEADELREAREFGAWVEKRRQIRWLRARDSELRLVNLETGAERRLEVGGRVLVGTPVFDPDGGAVWVVGARPEARDRSEVLRVEIDGGTRVVAGGPGFRAGPLPVPGGRWVVYREGVADPVPRPPAEEGADNPEPAGDERIAVHEIATGGIRGFSGREPALAASGRALAFWSLREETSTLHVLPLDRVVDAVAVFSTTDAVADLAVAPSAGAIAFRRMPRENWELYVVRPTAGEEESAGESRWDRGVETVRLTHEIQHDLYPTFLDDDTLLATIGEGRHRRSWLYDLTGRERTRLFHNNTLRTIAPEYDWRPSGDGTRVLVLAERDGDTVSPERGVYLVDLRRQVSREQLLIRLRRQLRAERDLRARGKAMFAPVADEVAEAVADVSLPRLYGYQADLFELDSKFVTEPGNARAREYIRAAFGSWGYEPELQWFEPEVRGEAVRTANVLATLRGTESPELIYVLSSHFDSTFRGPGADDNTSGTAVLLETARVLAERPLPSTVIFAAFTGEEAGLLGSREFVRRAEEEGSRIVGALNNDMLGWSGDQRLDNTIRYSNAGIRDLQHAAAFQFSDLITYDARYYKSTDAAAYYEAYGDIVGGIGSYPVLGNPHYHRSHDVLETINHELVRETTRTTVASLMLLASSPARLEGLEVVEEGGRRVVRWMPAPETGIDGYQVRLVGSDGTVRELGTVTEPRILLPEEARPDALVEVRAVNDRGLHGWDWARSPISGQDG